MHALFRFSGWNLHPPLVARSARFTRAAGQYNMLVVAEAATDQDNDSAVVMAAAHLTTAAKIWISVMMVVAASAMAMEPTMLTAPAAHRTTALGAHSPLNPILDSKDQC